MLKMNHSAIFCNITPVTLWLNISVDALETLVTDGYNFGGGAAAAKYLHPSCFRIVVKLFHTMCTWFENGIIQKTLCFLNVAAFR